MQAELSTTQLNHTAVQSIFMEMSEPYWTESRASSCGTDSAESAFSNPSLVPVLL